MKQKIAALITQYPLLKWLTNRFVLVTLFFVIWLVFFDTYSLFDQREIDKEINKLEDNKAYYQEEIHKDEVYINKLHKMEEVEKYAREKYYMKRDNEDIYIIEMDNGNDAASDESTK